MKLNNKGYTLVELLATMLILGILMAVTIPNIVGLSIQNKKTNYAEDAKKMKTKVEYLIRGDSSIQDTEKPISNGDCIVVALNLIHGSDFDSPPNGGKYLFNNSFVVMVKKSNQYYYYVQLVEDLDPDRASGVATDYVGYPLIEYSELEGSKYLDSGKYSELTGVSTLGGGFVNITMNKDSLSSSEMSTITSKTGCTDLKKIYYMT